MKKSIYLLSFFTVILLSCSKNQDLEFRILNNEIICLNNINIDSIKGNLDYSNKIYSQSRNIISYTIKNNSDKKYLLFFDDECMEFESYNKDEYSFWGSENARICLNLYSENTPLIKSSVRLFDRLSYEDNEREYDIYTSAYISDTLRQYRNRILGKSIVKNYNSNIILYPNETKRFKTVIYLPLNHSNYIGSLVNYFIIDDSIQSYKASIAIFNNLRETQKYLTEDLKKEIEENGYIIFDGILESNKVPVKLIPFEK